MFAFVCLSVTSLQELGSHWILAWNTAPAEFYPTEQHEHSQTVQVQCHHIWLEHSLITTVCFDCVIAVDMHCGMTVQMLTMGHFYCQNLTVWARTIKCGMTTHHRQNNDFQGSSPQYSDTEHGHHKLHNIPRRLVSTCRMFLALLYRFTGYFFFRLINLFASCVLYTTPNTVLVLNPISDRRQTHTSTKTCSNQSMTSVKNVTAIPSEAWSVVYCGIGITMLFVIHYYS